MNAKKNSDQMPDWIDLESVKTLRTAAEITSLSPDSLRRKYPHYIVRLSERRDGMKLKHALAIANGTAERA
jgi:hypothetical protein